MKHAVPTCKTIVVVASALFGMTTLASAQYKKTTTSSGSSSYTPPARSTYTPPARSTYTPPARSTYTPPARSTYTPPARSTYTPPARSTYTPPARSTYHPPSSSSSTSTYHPPSSSSSTSTYHPSTSPSSTSSVSRTGITTTPAGTVKDSSGGIHYSLHTESSAGLGGGAARTPNAALNPATFKSSDGVTHYSLNSPAASTGPVHDTAIRSSTFVGTHPVTGINSHPVPPGQVTARPGGGSTVTAADGRRFDVRPNGTVAAFHGRGADATFLRDGRVAHLHTAGMDINRGPHAERVFRSERPDHSVVVGMGVHAGYVQRPVVFGGRTVVERTYVRGGVVSVRVYSPYAFHGVMINTYVPAYYYPPTFYGWAYYGWAAPVPYTWGWVGSPWAVYYGPYYRPYPAYVAASNWLADYYLSRTLADSYAAANDGGGQQMADDGQGDAGGPAMNSDGTYAQADTPISPEVQNGIAQEVQQQISYENAASTQPDQAAKLAGLPQVLIPNHLFVVDQPLNVATADQQSCSLSSGNVIKLIATPDDQNPAANLTVVASRRADCPAGAQVTVSLEDLAEMQNNFRAQLDAGLKTLHDQQGTGGLPAPPDSALAIPPTPGAQLAPDQNVQALLQQQQQEASQAENNVTQLAYNSQSQ